MKDDLRSYHRHWHANASDEFKARKKRLAQERKERIAESIWTYKSIHPCVDCGENDPIVLEFDHVTEQKNFNISDAVKWGYALKRILAEIELCEIRCANCHRRVTYFRQRRI